MKKGISICDKCKKEVVSEMQYITPKDWKTFGLKDNSSNYNSIEMMICDECCEKIGITKTIDFKNNDIKEQLFNIVYSMLEEISQRVN